MKTHFLAKRWLWAVCLNSLFIFTAYAQENIGGTPPSFNLKTSSSARQSELPTYTTEAIPLQQLQREDAVFDKGKYPYRFGYNFNVSLDIKKEGLYTELEDGSKLWRFKVVCPGAVSVNFLYSSFHLPEGARLFLYNHDASIVLGAYTKNNNQETGRFGTETVAGEEVVLEYAEPASVEFPGELVLGVIVHGYRTHASSSPSPQAAGSCNFNINCPEAAGWENQKRAVARIIMNGNTLCTGTLINNTRNDDKPYFMTANHCIGDLNAATNPDASGFVFYWNYESATCSGTTGPQTQTTTGAKVRANSSGSDFALLELNSKPAASYNVFYAGWNRSTTASNGAVGIHHPAGDIKKFSKDNSTLIKHDNSFWLVPSWDIGVTEGGSSGSAIFDFNKRFIGQLLGGSSGCGSSDQSDIYGQFAFSWDKVGTTAATQLKGWLDPDNTGAITLEGKNPGTVSNNPPSVTITAPADQSGFVAPANFTIAATATDIDGTIAKVEFFNGATKLGEDATAPYTFAVTNLGLGTYTLTARVTDNGGATGTSAGVTVLVVTLRTPENPASTVNGIEYKYYEGDWSTVPNFAALTPVKSGNVTTIDVSTRNRDDNFGYRFTGYVNIAADGIYKFYTSSDDGSNLFIGSTLVVDNDGLHGETEASGTIGLKAGKHAITVNYFENGGDEIITVSYSGASLSKQVIPSAALFRNGPVTNQPPTVSITSPINNATFTAPATVAISATAADADGTISKVEFYNGATLLATDVSSPYTFSWTNVAAGTYTLTAKATDNSNATTTSSVVTITVTVVQPPAIATVYKHCNYDASGYAIGLAAGDYTLAQLVAKGISDNDISSLKIQSGYEIVLYADDNFQGTSLVVRADNTCLVNNSFNDVASSLRIRLITANQNPTVILTAPTNNSTYTAPASIALAATATDADGTISKVEFYNGATLLGTDVSSPYNFSWINVAAGTYTLTAKATDNSNAAVTSSAVTVTVSNPVNQLPVVSLTAPANNATYTAPATIVISATASDANGSVTKVEFFNGSTKIGEDLTAPYSYTLTNAAAGTYLFSAKATDNENASASSSSVSVTVTLNNNCPSLPAYVESNNYVAGSKVQNAGQRFECKPWPFSGWCNGAAWAYAPGTGAYWSDAWTALPACAAKSLTTNNNANGFNIAPNPASSTITVSFYSTAAVAIQLFNAYGHEVSTQTIHNGDQVDLTLFPAGVYTLKTIVEGEVIATKIVKQ